MLEGFDTRPFSPVDSLVLSCMAYLHLPEAFSARSISPVEM